MIGGSGWPGNAPFMAQERRFVLRGFERGQIHNSTH